MRAIVDENTYVHNYEHR